MKVFVPQSPAYPLCKVTATAGTWIETSLCDQSHIEADVNVPEGYDESEITVVGEFCNGRGEPQLPAVTLKTGIVKVKATPKAQPKVEKNETQKPAEAEAKTETKVTEKVEVKPAIGWDKLQS